MEWVNVFKRKVFRLVFGINKRFKLLLLLL